MTPDAGRFALYPRPPFRLDVTVVVLRRNAVNVVDRWDAEASINRRVLVVDGSAVEVADESVGTTEAPRLAVSVAPRNRTESSSKPLPGCCASCSASTSIWIPSTGAPPAKSGWRRLWRASPVSSRRSCRLCLRRWSAASRASSSHLPRACTCRGASATPTACSSVGTTHSRDRRISCVALRALRRLDTFPTDDVGGRNNLQSLLGLPGRPDLAETQVILERWRPYQGLVYFYLLLDSVSRDMRGVSAQRGHGSRTATG